MYPLFQTGELTKNKKGVEKKMDRHLIVVSVDAMVFEDLAYAQTLPNMGKLLRDGAVVQKVRTIYPSLTHPVHAALMSGCTAGKTGITSNELFAPGKLQKIWYNRLDQMGCDTIFHAAHRAGLTTAACRWPVTAGGFDVIDYLVPEVMEYETKETPDLEELYRKVCTPCLMEQIIKPRLSLLNGARHPYYDIFSIECACDIIRQYKPNLLMTHPGNVDAARHQNGLFGEAVHRALDEADQWIGQLMQAANDAGIGDSTTFAVISDHGHLEIKRSIALNVFLRDCGLLQVDEKGRLLDWRAYAHSTGLSAQIFVKGKPDEPVVEAVLKEMCTEGIYGISEVLNREEAKRRYGLYGAFAFAVETDGFTSFRDDWNRPAVRPLDILDYRFGRSTHGHMPEKGPQPPMLLCGPAIRPGIVVETGSVLDEAPTFAAILGISLPEAEGKPILELLQEA